MDSNEIFDIYISNLIEEEYEITNQVKIFQTNESVAYLTTRRANLTHMQKY